MSSPLFFRSAEVHGVIVELVAFSNPDSHCRGRCPFKYNSLFAYKIYSLGHPFDPLGGMVLGIRLGVCRFGKLVIGKL